MYTVLLNRKYVSKPAHNSYLVDYTPDPLVWSPASESANLPESNSSVLVLDPVKQLEQRFSDLGCSNRNIVLRSNDLTNLPQSYCEYIERELPLPAKLTAEDVSNDLKAELIELAKYCTTAITVSRNLLVHIYGHSSNVLYCEYKLKVLLSKISGFHAYRLDLPYSMHSLVSGRGRSNLKTLYDHTSVNVLMPPSINPPTNVSLDEIYFVGNDAQVVMALTLFQRAVIAPALNVKPFIERRSINPLISDMLNQNFVNSISEIMLKYATFVQLPPLGFRSSKLDYLVMGSTKCDVDSTINAVQKLCSQVYIVEVSNMPVDLQIKLNLCSGVNLVVSKTTLICGLSTNVKSALKMLETEGADMSVNILLYQPIELLDFVLGKKQGKILKIVNDTGAQITTVKQPQGQVFELKLNGKNISSCLHALQLLENELPAESELYIPEVFHKQVIGHGGQTIQRLMRKYNVYMRFENTAKERYTNQLGNSQTENVLIRCPMKNKQQIAAATTELLKFVSELETAHVKVELLLPRNDRRLLLSLCRGLIHDIELAHDVVITFPNFESAYDQTIIISGQTNENVLHAKQALQSKLKTTNYEFRIPYSPRFSEVVNADSSFSREVMLPLYLQFNAEIQTFDEVCMKNDDLIYSQIVVSVLNTGENWFSTIAATITKYLRSHKFDIVDCGEIATHTLTPIPTDVETNTPGPLASGALFKEFQPAFKVAFDPRKPETIPILSSPLAQPLPLSSASFTQQRLASNNETPVKRLGIRVESENTRELADAFTQPKLALKPRRAAAKFNRMF